jgi:hypothetical protein
VFAAGACSSRVAHSVTSASHDGQIAMCNGNAAQ